MFLETLRSMNRAQRLRWFGGGALVLVAMTAMLWPQSLPTAPKLPPDQLDRASDLPSPPADSERSQAPLPATTRAVATPSTDSQHASAGAGEVSHRLLFKAAYGETDSGLGLSHPPEGEGEVEGPSSFARLQDGTLVILDSQKKRLLWYNAEGRLLRTQTLPLDAPADVLAAEDGGLFVLDRWQDQALVSLDRNGQLRSRVALEELSKVDGMYLASGRVYVEEPGGLSRAVATTDGQVPAGGDPAESAYTQEGRVPGRLSPDGQVILSAAIDDRRQGQWSLSAMGGNPPKHVFSRQYDLDTSVLGVDIAGIDNSGTAYVTYTSSQEPGVALVCVDMDNGVPLGKVTLPQPELPVSRMRALQVLPEGGVVYANSHEDGMSYELFDCR